MVHGEKTKKGKKPSRIACDTNAISYLPEIFMSLKNKRVYVCMCEYACVVLAVGSQEHGQANVVIRSLLDDPSLHLC